MSFKSITESLPYIKPDRPSVWFVQYNPIGTSCQVLSVRILYGFHTKALKKQLNLDAPQSNVRSDFPKLISADYMEKKDYYNIEYDEEYVPDFDERGAA